MTINQISLLCDNEGVKPTILEKKIGASKGVISRAMNNNTDISSKWVGRIVENYPQYNPTWLLTGRGSMLLKEGGEGNSVASAVYKGGEGIPLIPVEAMAGWGSGAVQVMEYDLKRYVIPEFTELKVDFMITVKGSSMHPKYNSGDIVACRRIPSNTFFQWNKVYVLDTIQGAMIKRIHPSGKEGHISCVSDNPNYPPFDLPSKEIHALALVVGVIRLE